MTPWPMRAIRYHGREDVRLEELPDPTPGPGDVLLRVHANGVCGSDLHEYYHGPFFTSPRPHPLTGQTLPVVLGHEFGGTVVDVGSDVDDIEPSCLVAVEPIETCGVCASCRNGHRHLCRSIAFHGYHRDGGGLAELTCVPRSMVHPVPAGVGRLQAALVEPLAVACRAAHRTRAGEGDIVVVHGAGPIGIGALLTFRREGVRVIMSDPAEMRRRVAASLGAILVVDPTTDDVVAAARDLTDGLGAAGAVDAAGVGPAFKAAVAGTRPDGTVVVVAHHHDGPVPLRSNNLIFTEVNVTGSNIYRDEFDLVLDAIATGGYPLDEWVTTVPFDRLVTGAFEPLAHQEALKVVVDVDGTATR